MVNTVSVQSVLAAVDGPAAALRNAVRGAVEAMPAFPGYEDPAPLRSAWETRAYELAASLIPGEPVEAIALADAMLAWARRVAPVCGEAFEVVGSPTPAAILLRAHVRAAMRRGCDAEFRGVECEARKLASVAACALSAEGGTNVEAYELYNAAWIRAQAEVDARAVSAA